MEFFQSFIYILIITLSPITIFKLILKDYPISNKVGLGVTIFNILLTMLITYHANLNIYLILIETLAINIFNYKHVIDSDFNFKTITPLLKFLLVLFLFFFIPNLPYLFVNENIAIAYETLLGVVGNFLLIIMLVLIYLKDMIKYLSDFKEHFKEDIQVGLKSWYIGLTIMALANILIGLIFKDIKANNEELVQEMISVTPLLTLIATTLQAPVIEEITFRKTFKDMFHNPFFFIFFSGLAFGACHVIFTMNSNLDLLYIIPYGALGSSFAYMYKKTNNLCVPIVFHFIHNFLLTVFSIIL